MGLHANPVRRFAVWAFRRHTSLKNKEIAVLLNMSADQISDVSNRFNGASVSMMHWIEALDRYVTSDGI
jgi:hypothetical protein